MTKLSVNVNKIATLRNSRGGDMPSVTGIAQDILHFGAHGITVHPRPDGRHIRRQDVYDLKRMIDTYNKERSPFHVEFNVEGYPSADFLSMIHEIQPDQVTLVPDAPDVITSNQGWQLSQNIGTLTDIVGNFKQWQIRSSLFVDAFTFDEQELSALNQIQPDRIELYTEAYAKAYQQGNGEESVATYQQVAQKVRALGIGLNAGHDLNLENLSYLLSKIPEITEVSIGHALICESLYLGLDETIQRYLAIVSKGHLWEEH